MKTYNAVASKSMTAYMCFSIFEIDWVTDTVVSGFEIATSDSKLNVTSVRRTKIHYDKEGLAYIRRYNENHYLKDFMKCNI